MHTNDYLTSHSDHVGVVLVTGPAQPPVPLSEMLKHLRLEHHDEDTEIEGFLASARGFIESNSGRILFTSTYRQTMDRFPCHNQAIEILRAPVQSISSITYVDADGATQTLTASDYRVDLDGPLCRITPTYGESWPTTQIVTAAVKVTFVAGWATQDSIPADLKLAVKSMAAMLYKFRGDESKAAEGLPYAAKIIVDNWRLAVML